MNKKLTQLKYLLMSKNINNKLMSYKSNNYVQVNNNHL